MNTQFRKGIIEMCVVALLSRKDMYGYEIVQAIAVYTDINEGTVYPILRRLTQEGYFSTYLKESNFGPARKYYTITGKGMEFLYKQKREWVEIINMVENLLYPAKASEIKPNFLDGGKEEI